MRKRLLSILLTACMVWSLLPASAWAAGDPVEGPGGEIGADASAEDIAALFGEGCNVVDYTITLDQNVTLTGKITFTGGEWTLDLDGHTLTGPDRDSVLVIGADATLTLTSTEGGAVLGGEGETNEGAVYVSGTLTLEGSVALIGGSGGGHGVYVNGSGAALILGEEAKPKLTGVENGVGLFCDYGVTLTIGDGAAPVCTGNSGLVLPENATLNGYLTGGTFAHEGGGSGPAIYNPGNKSLLAPGYGYFAVEGGAWTAVSDSGYIKPSVTVKPLGGGVSNSTDAAAVESIFGGNAEKDPRGQYITLTDDVTLGQEVMFSGGDWTLDLNGYTLSLAEGLSVSHAVKCVDGTLTITDGYGGGGVDGGEAGAVFSTGTSLTISGGAFKGEPALGTMGAPTLTGGVFESVSGPAIVSETEPLPALLGEGCQYVDQDGDPVADGDLASATYLAVKDSITVPGGSINNDSTADEIQTVFGNKVTVSADGKTVTLTGNIQVRSEVEFETGTWTLDLNGHTLLGTGASAALSLDGGDLTLKGPGAVTGGSGEAAGPAVSVGNASELTLEGKLTLTGGESTDGAGGSGLALASGSLLDLLDGLDLTCIGGNGTDNGGMGVSGAAAEVEGTLTKGYFQCGDGWNGKAFSGNPLPLEAGFGYFEPEADEEYFFGLGVDVPQFLEVRAFDKNILVEELGDTPAQRYFKTLYDMNHYYKFLYDGKTINLLTDLSGDLAYKDSDYDPIAFTVDGHGNTLSREAGIFHPLVKLKYTASGTVTLKDLTLDGTGPELPGSSQYPGPVVYGPETNSPELVMDNVTVENNGYFDPPPAEPVEEGLPNAAVTVRDGNLTDTTIRNNLGDSVGGLWIYDGGEVTVTNSEVSGNLGGSAGGVLAEEDLAMSGVTIRGNTGITAGGVRVMGYEDPLTLTLSGTEEHPTLITGNRAAKPVFPSYYVREVYSELPSMAGGVLTNKAILSGDVAIKGNYVGQGTGTPANLVLMELPEMEEDEDEYDIAPPPETVAVVTGPLTGGAGSIGVSRVSMVMDESTWTVSVVPAPGVVARGATEEDGLTPYTLTQADLAAFFSDSPDYALALDEGNNAIVLTSKGVAEAGGRYYPTVDRALDAAPDGQSVRLLQNCVLQEALVINKKVTLDLNGCTITAGAQKNAIEVVTGGVLTLHDDSGAGEVIGGGRPAGDSSAACSGVFVDGGKLILSGRVRATGGVHEDGTGGAGVYCYKGALALAPGAEPTLTGGEGKGESNGGAGLFLGGYGDVEGFLTGGAYVGGPGGTNAGSGLEVQWNDDDVYPILSGGCYKGINMHTGMTGLPALLPEYCYYADEDGDKLDPQPSSTYTRDTVTVARLGGPVRNIYEFQAALGGADCALIDPQTNTVTLDDDVELMLPVEIAAGTYTLDLRGYNLTGAPGVVLETSDTAGVSNGKPALVLDGAGVRLTVTDSYPGGHGGRNAVTGGAAGTFYQFDATQNATGGAGILVEAGALTVTGDARVVGGDGTGDANGGTGGAGVQVLGGSLTLTGTPYITGGYGKSGGGNGVLVGTEGTLRVPQGAWPTVSGGGGDSELWRGYGVTLSGTAQIAGGSYSGRAGGQVLDTTSGAVTITGGSFTGTLYYGFQAMYYKSLAISGGAFKGKEGQAALWVMPLGSGAYKGILSGGSFLGGKAIELNTSIEGDETAVPADLLAEGFHFYDGDQDIAEGQTGETLPGPVTVGRARWTEFADTAWYDGQKSEFTLTTAEELAGLAELVNGGNSLGSKTVKLGADIDLSAHDWVPIGGTVDIFYGEFDGQGHAITGMNVTGDWEYAGLFSVCRSTIHDLTLSGNVSAARTSGTACVGGLAGFVYGGAIEVYNVLFTGTVSLAGRDGMVGGLVGEMEASDTALSNCAALAEVSVGPVGSPAGVRNVYIVYAGGLVGGVSGYDGDPKVDLRNCYVAGTVTVQPGAGPVRTAALVGDAENATEVTGPLYYLNTMGAPSGFGAFTNAPTAMTAEEMQSTAFADTLNGWVTAQGEDAGYAAWYAHTGAYPDFTKSGGGSSGGTGGSSGSTTTTKTETNPDGSKTTTVTDQKTGTVTETTKGENGVETVVKTEKDGTVTAAVTVPQTALTPPKEGGVPLVEIPGQSIPTGGSGTGEGATAIAVDLPGALDTPVIVAIPVTDGTVVLRGDGTPVALSLVEDGKAYVVLEASEELRIVTAGDFFDDVEGAAKAAADFGAARALWTGTGEREFSPEMIMNRAMLATVLWRLNGAENPEGLELFPDVPPEAWFASAAAWGGETGVVQGTGEGFAPDVALTAEQMLVMLYRYTTYADLLVPAADDTGAGAPEGTSSWAAEAVAWAINAGLVRLGEDGDLTAPITRAQAAEIMRGYVGYLVRR